LCLSGLRQQFIVVRPQALRDNAEKHCRYFSQAWAHWEASPLCHPAYGGNPEGGEDQGHNSFWDVCQAPIGKTKKESRRISYHEDNDLL